MRHAHKHRTRAIFSMTLIMLLCACNGRQSHSVATTPEANHAAVLGISTASQPKNRTGVRAGIPSFTVLMGRLNARQQTQVRDWYSLIDAPAVDDATPAQVAWMQARGYPMPDDIARAESISQTELKTAAGTGDTKAQILYFANLLGEYNRIYGSVKGPVDPARYRDPNRIRLLDEINRTMLQVLASGSPYAGYLYAAEDRLMYSGDLESSAASLLAGLVWASKFGDTRADQILNSPTVQAVNAVTAGAAMNLMLKKALYANPALFSTSITPIPSSNH